MACCNKLSSFYFQIFITGYVALISYASPTGKCSIQDIYREGLLCSREAVMSLRSDEDLSCRSEYERIVPLCLSKSLTKCHDPAGNKTEVDFTNTIVNLTMTVFSSERFCSANLIVKTPENCTVDFQTEYGTCALLFGKQVLSAAGEPLLCSSYQSMTSCLNSTAVDYCGPTYVDDYMQVYGEFFVESNNPFCSIQQLDDGDNHKVIQSSADHVRNNSFTYVALLLALCWLFK